MRSPATPCNSPSGDDARRSGDRHRRVVPGAVDGFSVGLHQRTVHVYNPTKLYTKVADANQYRDRRQAYEGGATSDRSEDQARGRRGRIKDTCSYKTANEN